MTIKNEISSNSLNEINHGKLNVYFALYDEKKEEIITPFCKCKDYFQDIRWSSETKNDFLVHGFNWKYGVYEDVLNRKSQYVVMKKRFESKDENFNEKEVLSLQTLINKFDKSLKFKKTTIDISDDFKYLFIKYDLKWTKIPYLNSVFFLLLRNGLVYNIEKSPIEHFCNKGEVATATN